MLRHNNACVRDVLTAPSNVYLNFGLNLFHSYFSFVFQSCIWDLRFSYRCHFSRVSFRATERWYSWIDGAIKTSRTYALLWRNTGPLPGGVLSHHLCFALKKMLRLLPKIEGFGGIPGSEAYQIRNEYVQRRRLHRNKFTSKSEVFPTWAPLPNPKEMKASLSKVQALKFILQHAASKLRFSKLQSSNSTF